ncbi:MAG: hypothetical protein IH588_20455, partial [Anaerolineales bacterium]|nr:hypothetical protein [Anaerolineales bacterium]
MQKQSEEQRAKAAYNWLRVSPLATLLTLAYVAGTNLPSNICAELTGLCQYNIAGQVDIIAGILISALWHLTLLRFANDSDSEFVRRHGRRALMYAGVRTVIPLSASLLDALLNLGGALACCSIPILIILWGTNTKAGLREIASELGTDKIPNEEMQLNRTPSTILEPILWNLRAENPSTRVSALKRLYSVDSINEAIRLELENLAVGDKDEEIKNKAREIIAFFEESKPSAFSNQIITTESVMSENNDSRPPEEILDEIYGNLQSHEDTIILSALEEIMDINFSSQAVLRQLEKLSLQSSNKEIRENARAALALPSQRRVRSRLNKLQRGDRYILLQEINEWEKGGLLPAENAEVVRRRYDFDFEVKPSALTSNQISLKSAPAQAAFVNAEAEASKAQPAVPMKRSEPEGPRPSLLQTLTSEASIKIYLYLGAFFVIASAAILGVAIPELRLPILIIGTLIFGGLAIAIKKRLPQPSFALFIVFSFLLPITANTVQETLSQSMNLSSAFNAGYWMFVYFIMAVIWSGSTWFYESRLFSVTAFISLTLALLRIGDIFDAQSEFYTSATGLAPIAGLAGYWLLKKWKDAKFALPIFLAAQGLQVIILIASISIFGVNTFDPSNTPFWHLATFLTWILAFVFYILSNILQPFLFFPWLAAGALIPMPWFLAAAFDIESLGSTILLFAWGTMLSIASDVTHRIEPTRKYSLPILLASMPTFALGIITGFAYSTTLGMIAAFGVAAIYTLLHILRTRWWLWTLALLNFIIAYFAFFNLEAIQKLNLFFGYQPLFLSIIFLLPDLFLNKDLRANLEWRLPPRIFGVIFAVFTSIAILFQNESNHVAVCYAVYVLFFAAYTFKQRNAIFGYLPAAYLPLSIIFALNFFEIDAWLPALTALAVLYFIFGIAIRAKENWARMLRNSSLALGTTIAFAALLLLKEQGGWYALAIGLLYIAEMYLSRNGWFEVGAPVLFNVGVFLILRDFNVNEPAYHLLAYSLVWLLADLLAHLTFTNPRPLAWIVRGIGAFFAVTDYGFLLFGNDDSIARTGFGIYTLLFLLISLLYRRATLFYAFT